MSYNPEANDTLTESLRRENISLRHRLQALERLISQRTADLSQTRAELARHGRTRDDFLANMSHELRTPLNAVLGLTESLQELTYGPLSERQQQTLRTIERNARALLLMINDMLELAKIEAGKIRLVTSQVVLEEVCQEILLLMQEQAQHKQIDLSFSQNDLHTVIDADPRRIKQILFHLLQNAIKFTPEGGHIGLDVVTDHQRETVSLSVWDTGIGIAPEYMEMLFKPFQQLDGGLDRHHGGVGLGLVLVSRLVALHHGGVSVASEVAEGSRFTVTLPLSPEASPNGANGAGADTRPTTIPEQNTAAPVALAAGAGDGTQTSSGTGQRDSDTPPPLILLAEQNEELLVCWRTELERHGYLVLVAHTGDELLSYIREQVPALVVLDLHAPGVQGARTIQTLRSFAGIERMGLVVLTLIDLPGQRDACLAAGANDYLPLPVSGHQLAHCAMHMIQAHDHSYTHPLC